MIKKTASVHWDGEGKDARGAISTQTGLLKDLPYGFASRFENDIRGTNPEEILGAAHAACFTMAFSFYCAKAGLSPRDVNTQAAVTLTADGEGYAIDTIALTLEATVPGIDDARFQALAAQAKSDCPLSKALAGVRKITLTAIKR